MRLVFNDPRDNRPEPPAYLDPDSVLRNRERARQLLAFGVLTWPRPGTPQWGNDR